MNEYYVYVLLDGTKPGFFIYEDLKFDFEPFYIGKGSKDRIYSTLFEGSIYKVRKMNSIKNKGGKIISMKIFNNLECLESFRLEQEVIKKIGRRNLKLGPLCNLTDGGEGRINVIVSEETRKKMSFSRKALNLHINHTDQTKDLLRSINFGEKNPMYGKNHTEEVKEKHSLRVSGLSHPMFGKTHSPETIDKIKNSLKGVDYEKKAQESIERNSKEVLQFDLNGNFIKEYESIKSASKEIGLSESLIGKCCRRIVKTPRQFRFEFKHKNSLILSNSFQIKIGDLFLIDGEEYKMEKRNKNTIIASYEWKFYTFRRKDHEFLFEKRSIDREIDQLSK